MALGLIVVLLLFVDIVTKRVNNVYLFVLILVFLFYSFLISIIASDRILSLSWTMKLALWMLTFLAAMERFHEMGDLNTLSLLVIFSILIIICSFCLSYMGIIDTKNMVYETGVTSYSGGFSSGKIIAYYLAFSVPVLYSRMKAEKKKSILLFTVFVASIVVMILTFVRAPIAGLLIGLFIYSFYNILYNDKGMLKTLIIISLMGLTIGTIFFVFKDNMYLSRWLDLGNQFEQGQIEKLGSGRVGLLTHFYDYYINEASFVDKMFGTGLGSSLNLLGVKKFVHNDFAEILMGLGIIGFSLYGMVLLGIYRTLIKAVKNAVNQKAKDYTILSIGYFFIFVSFHWTNVTGAVLVLFLWATFSGAIVGVGQAESETNNYQEINTIRY